MESSAAAAVTSPTPSTSIRRALNRLLGPTIRRPTMPTMDCPKAKALRVMLENVANAGPRPRGTTPTVVLSESMSAIPIPEFGGGMGVIADVGIESGSLLASIPSDALLTGASARRWLFAAAYQDTTEQVDRSAGVLQRLRQMLSPNVDTLSPLAANDYLKSVKKGLAALTSMDAIYLFLLAHRVLRLAPEESSSLLALPSNLLAGSPLGREVSAARLLAAWVSHLPHRYDNLLELTTRFPEDGPLADVDLVVSSPLLAHVVKREIDTWRRTKAKVEDFLGQELLRCASSRVRFLDTDFLWAYNSLMSRGFSYDEEVWCMMPYVDYINYSQDEPNVTMDFVPTHGRTATGGPSEDDEESLDSDGETTVKAKRPNTPVAFPSSNLQGTYDFRARQDIDKGAQLFLTYGVYSDSELALWYGFNLNRILLDGGRPYDPFLRNTLTAYPLSTLTDACGCSVESPQTAAIYLLSLLALPSTHTGDMNNKRVAGTKDTRTELGSSLLTVHPVTHECVPVGSQGTLPQPAVDAIRKVFNDFTLCAEQREVRFSATGTHGIFVQTSEDIRVSMDGITPKFAMMAEFLTSLLGLMEGEASTIPRRRSRQAPHLAPEAVSVAQQYVLRADASAKAGVHSTLLEAVRRRVKGGAAKGGVGLVVATLLSQELHVLNHNRAVAGKVLEGVAGSRAHVIAQEVSEDHVRLLEGLVGRFSKQSGGVDEEEVIRWMYNAYSGPPAIPTVDPPLRNS